MVGVLTAKAINIPTNINTCVIYRKFVLDKTLKSVQPIKDCIVIIDSNINNEPKNVYKKK
jgi:hypothetical protein